MPLPTDWTGTLVPRQVRLYLARGWVFRQIPNGVNDAVWSLVLSNLPCYVFTTPNRDNAEYGGDILQVKEPGVFLFNHLAFPVGADVEAEDAFLYAGPVAGQPPSPDSGDFFKVMGYSKNRPSSGARRNNKGEVYLNPDGIPPILRSELLSLVLPTTLIPSPV